SAAAIAMILFIVCLPWFGGVPTPALSPKRKSPAGPGFFYILLCSRLLLGGFGFLHLGFFLRLGFRIAIGFLLVAGFLVRLAARVGSGLVLGLLLGDGLRVLCAGLLYLVHRLVHRARGGGSRGLRGLGGFRGLRERGAGKGERDGNCEEFLHVWLLVVYRYMCLMARLITRHGRIGAQALVLT